MSRAAQAIPGWPARASPGSEMSETGTSCRSVPVVIRLVRAINRNADVRGLLFAEHREADAERVQVQPGDLLIQVLGQHVHAEGIVARSR